MNTWLVDTNVLLDVITHDPLFGERSEAVLERCAQRGVLVVNPIISAEICAGAEVTTLEELDELLPHELFRRDDLPWQACFLAGRAYRQYKDKYRGGKPRMLADFLIGAHAALTDMTLISRDRDYLRYFNLDLLDPTGMQ